MTYVSCVIVFQVLLVGFIIPELMMGWGKLISRSEGLKFFTTKVL